MERKLAAILAADVVGYAALMERDEKGTHERLTAGRKELFDPEIARHHGRVFKLMGDGMLAEFGSVVDAVECAVSLQRGLAERNANVSEDQRVQVRIGINLGEVIVEGDDRYGEGVNIAARLEQIADPGGICVSGKVAREVEKKLAFGFEPMGAQQVKNIAEPVQAFRVKLDGLPRRRAAGLPRQRAKVRAWSTAVALVLLVAVGGAFWTISWWRVTGTPVFDKPSIAVLPFDNLGDDPKWERLADGITEDIITDLSHSKALYVIARNSTEVYKGKAIDIRQVGRDLGVKYVLEGSIQVAGNQMRVTAQLIEADAGSHVWAERYDRPTEDIFAVQSEVTEKIATTITGYQGAVAEAERAIAHRKPPQNLTAYDYYLLGMEAKHSLTKEGFFQAEELFHKAIESDPQLARAYVGLEYTYNYMIDFGLTSSVAETLDKQLDAAQKAVLLDPDDGETHLALALAYSYRSEWQKAATEYRRAEDLSPNNADVLMLCAWGLPFLGNTEHAVDLADRAVRLNPHYPDWYLQGLRLVYFFGRRFDASLEFARQLKNPFALDYAIMAMDEAYLGNDADAHSAVANVLRLDPEWSAERWISEQGGFARDQEASLFVEGAQKAGLPICVTEAGLKQQPNLLRLKVCDEQRAKNVSG